MVLVKNRVKYFYYILSIKAAKCNPFCKRFIRGSCNYYTKNLRKFLCFPASFFGTVYGPFTTAYNLYTAGPSFCISCVSGHHLVAFSGLSAG